MGPGPWKPQTQPHVQTTRLSRFRPGMPPAIGQDKPLAATVFQARCEVSDENICQPANMAISASCIAITAAGGWKNRDPLIHYFMLDGERKIFDCAHSFDPRLSSVARDVLIDESRKLIVVGDDERVKSFSWETTRGKAFDEHPLPVHTLDSLGCPGPLALLPQGRLVRAGRGQAFLWNINNLETHGPSGDELIGEGEYNIEDSWRDNDDGDAIEQSTGSKPHQTIKFAEKDFTPCSWHLHTPTNRLIASHRPAATRGPGYGCIAIDLEAGGKTAMRYLGHAGQVEGFSASEVEPNWFATACSDGFARIYDARHALPVMTFKASGSDEFCSDVAFASPDGIPGKRST